MGLGLEDLTEFRLYRAYLGLEVCRLGLGVAGFWDVGVVEGLWVLRLRSCSSYNGLLLRILNQLTMIRKPFI